MPVDRICRLVHRCAWALKRQAGPQADTSGLGILGHGGMWTAQISRSGDVCEGGLLK